MHLPSFFLMEKNPLVKNNPLFTNSHFHDSRGHEFTIHKVLEIHPHENRALMIGCVGCDLTLIITGVRPKDSKR